MVAVLVVASLAVHREPLGFAMRAFRGTMRDWGGVIVLCAGAVLLGCVLSERPMYLLFRGCLYFVWCVVQQVLLQKIIYGRIRVSMGAGWAASLLAGLLFAVVHFPNPVLMPATFVWGTLSTRLFERHPSIVALALFQTLLSSLLIWATPVAWNHQFRVGPGYWRY